MAEKLSRIGAALPIWMLLIGAPAYGLLRDGALFGRPQMAILVLAAIGLVAGLAVAKWAGEKTRVILGATGLFLGVTMLIVPARWTLFEGDAALDPSALELIATAALLLGAGLARRYAARATVMLAGAGSLACLGGGVVGFALVRHVDPPKVTTRATGPNIYQFVFDGMTARAFDPPAAERPGWDGFVAYPNNRTNYAATDASLPSMFAGDVFKGGSFRAFQDRARNGGYRGALRDAGYAVSLYTPDRNRFWWFDRATYSSTAQDRLRVRNDPHGIRTLFQIGIAHAAPPGLKKPTLGLTRLIWAWSWYNRYKQDLGLIDRFIADEATRPPRGQYIYLHIMIPHPPYDLDAACRPAKSGYVAQADCATRLAARMIARLRALGRLEDSLVIVQGDHGFHASETDLPDIREPIPDSVRTRLDGLGDSFGADDLMQRSHGLLVLHRPGATAAPLIVLDEESQLIDLAPTIAETAGLGVVRGPGRSLLRDNAGPRDWHFFAGLTSKPGLTRRRLGRDTDEGRLAHVVREANGGWRIEPFVIANGSAVIPGR